MKDGDTLMLTATGMGAAFRRREISPTEVVETSLAVLDVSDCGDE
ncbi:MAG TPA: hypothetical protein VMI52_08145 [Acetobacteraceae bacterium]|nr:hypothetical protein [Acetobacteraceae bacterium]